MGDDEDSEKESMKEISMRKLAEREKRKVLKMKQKAVLEELEEAFKHPYMKNWSGSNPRGAFENSKFNCENWNDRRVNLIRAIFDSDGIWCETRELGNFVACHNWVDDMNYVFILNEKTHDTYVIKWYKSRGCTDLILKNGELISLLDYMLLLKGLATSEELEEAW